MYFEARLKNRKFGIEVAESRHHWQLSIQEEGKASVEYEISKSDYKEAEAYISFLFKGSSYLIDVVRGDIEYTVFTRSSFRTIPIFNDEMLLHESLKKAKGFGIGKQLKAGMPGKVVRVLAQVGQEVEPDQPLIVVEAMKMENEIRVSEKVKIKEIRVKDGESVEANSILMIFE